MSRPADIIPIRRRTPTTTAARSILCSCCGEVREVAEPAPILLTFADGASLVYLACDGCEEAIARVGAAVGLSVVSLSILRDEMQELRKPDPTVVGRVARRVQWRQNPARVIGAAAKAVES